MLITLITLLFLYSIKKLGLNSLEHKNSSFFNKDNSQKDFTPIIPHPQQPIRTVASLNKPYKLKVPPRRDLTKYYSGRLKI